MQWKYAGKQKIGIVIAMICNLAKMWLKEKVLYCLKMLFCKSFDVRLLIGTFRTQRQIFR